MWAAFPGLGSGTVPSMALLLTRVACPNAAASVHFC